MATVASAGPRTRNGVNTFGKARQREKRLIATLHHTNVQAAVRQYFAPAGLRWAALRVRMSELESPAPGRVAQWESARFTRERSLVRNQARPPEDCLLTRSFSGHTSTIRPHAQGVEVLLLPGCCPIGAVDERL